MGIFPSEASAIRLVGAILADLHDEWQATDRRYLSEHSMAKLQPPSDTITPAELQPTADTDAQPPIPTSSRDAPGYASMSGSSTASGT